MPPPIEISTSFTRHTLISRHEAVIVSAFVGALFIPLELTDSTARSASLVTWFAVGIVLRAILWWARSRNGRVRVDEGGITLGGRRIGREAMRFGAVAPARGGARDRVEILDARGAPLATIDVAAGMGDQILSQLGIGAAVFFKTESCTLSLSSLLRGITGSCGLLMVGLGVSLTALPGPVGPLTGLLGLIALAVSVILLGPKRVIVARDGIFVQSRLGVRRRFIPWSDVISLRSTWGGVKLELVRGALAVPAEADTKSALLARIEEGLSAYRNNDATDLGARLARRGRGREAWLRALSGRAGDFRSAPVSDEQLWHLVESAGPPATARAAAALILMRDAGEEGRRRLRIAADACALPPLRVVLDEAGKGAREEVLGDALDELEDEAEVGCVKEARVGG